MSSTWFKSVEAYKILIGETYKDWHYILIAETAESNLYNFNGGHDYHKWIIACGNYRQVFNDIVEFSVGFEDGSAKWKPNAKDACGFIRMCKKALETATERTTIPYNVEGIIMYCTDKNIVNQQIAEMLLKDNKVVKKPFFNDFKIETDDIATYIKYKEFVKTLWEDYRRDKMEKYEDYFEDFFNNHKDWYRKYLEF